MDLLASPSLPIHVSTIKKETSREKNNGQLSRYTCSSYILVQGLFLLLTLAMVVSWPVCVFIPF